MKSDEMPLVETHGRAPSARAETCYFMLLGTLFCLYTLHNPPPFRASVSFDTALKRPIERNTA